MIDVFEIAADRALLCLILLASGNIKIEAHLDNASIANNVNVVNNVNIANNVSIANSVNNVNTVHNAKNTLSNMRSQRVFEISQDFLRSHKIF